MSPRNVKIAAIYFMLATFFVAACSKQDDEAARAAVEVAIQEQLAQAQALLFNGDTQQALMILEALDTDYENRPEIIEQLAFAYSEVPDPTMAGIYFDRVYELDPNRSDIALYAASAHSESGDWAAAAHSYENYLKAEPLDSSAWKSLARAYQTDGKLQPALDAWLRAFKADKSKPNAFEAVTLGDLYYDLNNKPQAERWWDYALEQPNIDDAHAAATVGKLRLALAKENWAEAEALVKTAEQRYPGALEEAGLEGVPSQLADLREATTLVTTTTVAEGVEIKKPEQETEADVTNVADIEDEGPSKLSVIEDDETVVTTETEDGDTTVTVTETTVEMDEPESPDSPGIITVTEGTASVTYAAGEDGPTKLSVIEDETVEEETVAPTPLAETEEEAPPPPVEPSTLFAKGTAALENAQFPEAIRFLQLSLANENPNNANAFYDLSRAYYGIGQWQQAELYASEALRRQPDNLFYEVQYLRVLQKSQSRQKLMDELVRAHDMFPNSPDIALALARGYDYIEKNPRNATYMYETFLELAPMDHPMRPEIEQYLSGQ